MNKQQASEVVRGTFASAFDKPRFGQFTLNILNWLDESKAQQWSTQYIKDAFKEHVHRYERLGSYTAPDGRKLDVLIVHLAADSKLERARTAARNFVADHLKKRDEKDAALVAFVSPSEQQWRFSYVKMEYATVEKDTGKIGVEERLTPARRFSYLVGEGESCHTAQTRFLGLLQETDKNPGLEDIEEAFSVEAVTNEFFARYVALFEDIHTSLDKLAGKDKVIRDEFKSMGVSTVDFAKKLLGQIVFLYFLQKKGWLGVEKGKEWGSGPRNFLRRLANGEYGKFKNFFNDILEPLFYDTLATERGHEAWCKNFKCRIPFLNGGLFEPIAGYDWRNTDIVLPNDLFTNDEQVEEGIVGTGVLDVFDRYNFTVNESEPLEKEVAIDPEMLGKVFENLIEDNRRKGLGAFYTPREIVHYMCQESLINYLDTALNGAPAPAPAKTEIQGGLFGAEPTQMKLPSDGKKGAVPRHDIETFVRLGEQISHYESVEADYRIKMPKSIEKNAKAMDDALKFIAVCDPAVGSGAFPVGMLTEIVRARLSLTPYFNEAGERTPYNFKRHAIQNCLYGVDIDSSAIDIAKLRLWLSLVVDEEEVKDIKPLPNLDYKVVVGNSLMGVEKNLFNNEQFKRLESLKPEFFNETAHNAKAALKRQIEAVIHELTNDREVFDYEVYFSEVFHAKQGFDIVIANPPYISAIEFTSKHSREERALLGERYETASGAYDIYVLFIEQGMRLLCNGGTLAYINPNKYLSAKYAEALRAYILEIGSLISLLDVSGIIVFEQAAVYPVVSLIAKRTQSNGEVKLILPKARQTADYDQKNFYESSVPFSVLRSLPEFIWGFLLSPNVELLLKMTQSALTLADVASINASTTAGEAEDYGACFQNKPVKDALKVVNTGTIERFCCLWGNTALTHGGQKYLTPYLPLGRGVNDRRVLLYRSPKLIFAKMAKICEAFYDDKGEYASVNTNCLYNAKNGVSLGFLAGYCNSRVFMFFYEQYFGSLRMSGGYFQFQSPQLRVIPIKKPDKKTDRAVENLVLKVLSAKHRNPQADTWKLEREIDGLIYELFNLSRDEIKIVEAGL